MNPLDVEPPLTYKRPLKISVLKSIGFKSVYTFLNSYLCRKLKRRWRKSLWFLWKLLLLRKASLIKFFPLSQRRHVRRLPNLSGYLLRFFKMVYTEAISAETRIFLKICWFFNYTGLIMKKKTRLIFGDNKRIREKREWTQN